MTTNLLDGSGLICQISELRVSKAISLAQALQKGDIDYATLVECRTTKLADIIIFDVEVEVPQLPVHSVNRKERIAAHFSESDETPPEVLVLRSDFPSVPHLNLREVELPRSLCLYEEQYSDLKRRWTAPRFVGHVRQWLARTAKGKLHQEDQPLEPLLVGHAGQIILPFRFLEQKAGDVPERLYLTATSKDFFIGHCEKPPQPIFSLPIVVSVHCCPPQQHGIIRRRPPSLAELSAVFQNLGHDLLGEIRARLKRWREEANLDKEAYRSPLILVIVCPKTRGAENKPESVDILAFITNLPVEEIGEGIGIWQVSEGHLCPLIFDDTSKCGQDVRIDLLNPSFHLTRDMAAKLNGREHPSTISVAAIGLGALGSQVVMNLLRSGFGKWTFIDDDRLMPHNISRHALNGAYIGHEKSTVMAEEAKWIIREKDFCAAIPADVMNPGKYAENIGEALKNSDIILDMSASVSVERFLALDVDSPARRMSLFLNPSGDDLVFLAEDKTRSMKLDELEMQYYRGLVTLDELGGHFKPSLSRTRYGQSCRDITSTLPQDLVALHSAIGSRYIKEIAFSEGASINVWRADSFGNVRRVPVDPCPTIRHRMGEWTICTDTGLLLKLHQLRDQKLPNETGGVLLGSFDLERRIVYIVDTIPSPPDSTEWPMLYIRGCRGLKQEVERASTDTDGSVEYIGEWHSHPAGMCTTPSDDDQQVFSWLTELMSRDGLPALMMIVGGAGEASCFIGEMRPLESLLPRLVPT